MKREIKEAWLNRLESPEAKHTRLKLHNSETGGMCCLGHLMAVCGIEPEEFVNNCHESDEGIPSVEFLNSVGLSFGKASDLADMNDRWGRFPLHPIRALPVED
jgi:hypothetical protein